MRLFVALPVPETHRRELATAAESLRAAAPRARWERVEKLHLTLVFLGEVGRERVGALVEALRAVCAGFPPLRLRLGEPGAFPGRERARVLWVGLAGDEGLAGLQSTVGAACVPYVERRDDRPFHAHLTLARCDPAWRGVEVDRFVSRLLVATAGAAGEPFDVSEVLLVESELGPGGSRYRDVVRLLLAGGAA